MTGAGTLAGVITPPAGFPQKGEELRDIDNLPKIATYKERSLTRQPTPRPPLWGGCTAPAAAGPLRSLRPGSAPASSCRHIGCNRNV